MIIRFYLNFKKKNILKHSYAYKAYRYEQTKTKQKPSKRGGQVDQSQNNFDDRSVKLMTKSVE